MTIQAKTITVDELVELPDDGFQYELVEGELRKMPPPGPEQGEIVAILAISLGGYILAQRLGKIRVETGYLLSENPDTVLSPDLSFVRQERLESSARRHSYPGGAPDLAVEVVSPSDRYTEVQEKASRWLQAGTRLVWVIDPRRQQVAVYRTPTAVTILSAEDILEGGDVVPGWTMQVRELFA